MGAKSLKYLSTAFNKDGNVYKLVKIIDDAFDDLVNELEDVRKAHFVNHATGRNLDAIASCLTVVRIQNENDNRFRVRIKLEAAKVTNNATINEIKQIIATALQIGTSRVKIKETDISAMVKVFIWHNDLEKAGISIEEFKDLARLIKPAGVKLLLIEQGTFTYRSAGQENDPTKGYNDLNNSNPNAGTYAGLL